MTVRADPDRATMYWDTLQYGLALSVQPTGHRRGSASTRPGAVHGGFIWAMPVQYHWSTHADWRPKSWFRSPRVAIPMPTDLHCVAEGRSSRWPTATSTNMPERKTRAGGKRRRLLRGICCRDGPGWISAVSDGRTSSQPIAAITAPVLANQVLAAAGAIFSWAVRQEIVSANPCSGVERNDTTSRERVLSDTEIVAFWPHLSAR